MVLMWHLNAFKTVSSKVICLQYTVQQKTLEGKKLWRIWQITTIRQLFFANFPVLQ